MKFVWIVGGIVVVIALIAMFYNTFYIRKKCTASVPGHFLYPEWQAEIDGRTVHARWNPVYEYRVGDTVYIAELDVRSESDKFGIQEVEVRYLPSRPDICYIVGMRGRILSSRKQTDEAEKQTDDAAKPKGI